MVTHAQWASLYRAFLREGAKFPNYNIREYVMRRSKDDFSASSASGTPAELYRQAQEQLEVVKRQCLVYSMYARKHKSVMDL